MPKQHINPPGLPKPPGLFSHVVKAGTTVYITGQVALDADNTVVGKDDFTVQVEHVFRCLHACLTAAGATARDLVKVTAYLTREQDIPAYRQARDKWLAQSLAASTTVLVSRLVNPDCLVAVDGVAVLE